MQYFEEFWRLSDSVDKNGLHYLPLVNHVFSQCAEKKLHSRERRRKLISLKMQGKCTPAPSSVVEKLQNYQEVL
jgi:hypothetical protein